MYVAIVSRHQAQQSVPPTRPLQACCRFTPAECQTCHFNYSSAFCSERLARHLEAEKCTARRLPVLCFWGSVEVLRRRATLPRPTVNFILWLLQGSSHCRPMKSKMLEYSSRGRKMPAPSCYPKFPKKFIGSVSASGLVTLGHGSTEGCYSGAS